MQRRINDRVTVSGQIEAGGVEAIAEAGFSAIVCARPDGEVPGQPEASEIEKAAARHDLAFAHIPVRPGVPPSKEDAERFASLGEAGPVFAYCGAGPRAVFLAGAAAIRSGRSIEEVVNEAMEAGIDLSPALPVLQSMTRTDDKA
jgi:sulfide:quinone oxidoreductase